MSVFVGMDTDSARICAGLIEEHNSAIQHATQQAAAELEASTWEGEDATRFRLRAHATLVSHCLSLTTRLTTLAAELESEALQQDVASHSESQHASTVATNTPHSLAATFGMPRVPPMGRPTLSQGESRIAGEARIAIALLEQLLRLKFGSNSLVLTPSTDPSSIVSISQYPPGEAAQDLAGLLHDNHEAKVFNGAGPEAGNIRVQQLRTAAGETTWVVHIPPTQSKIENLSAWDGSQGNARDWLTNFFILAGYYTSSMKDVEQAMAVAGVPKGAPVAIVGHSQGGLIGAALASRPSFNGPGGYNVTHVLSAGSPTGSFTPAQTGTHVVNMSHDEGTNWELRLGSNGVSFESGFTGDPIPLTDLADFGYKGPLPPGVEEVELSAPIGHGAAGYEFDIVANHQNVQENPDGSINMHIGYYPTVLANQDTHPRLLQLRNEMEGLYFGDGVTLVSDTNVQMVRKENKGK